MIQQFRLASLHTPLLHRIVLLILHLPQPIIPRADSIFFLLQWRNDTLSFNPILTSGASLPSKTSMPSNESNPPAHTSPLPEASRSSHGHGSSSALHAPSSSWSTVTATTSAGPSRPPPSSSPRWASPASLSISKATADPRATRSSSPVSISSSMTASPSSDPSSKTPSSSVDLVVHDLFSLRRVHGWRDLPPHPLRRSGRFSQRSVGRTDVHIPPENLSLTARYSISPITHILCLIARLFPTWAIVPAPDLLYKSVKVDHKVIADMNPVRYRGKPRLGTIAKPLRITDHLNQRLRDPVQHGCMEGCQSEPLDHLT